MARLAAAFGSSHSIMLTAERADWLGAFRESDRKMPLFDKHGAARSYDELLASVSAEARAAVTDKSLAAAHERTQALIADLKRQMDATPLDALVIVGDDQHELFEDALMPALAVFYGQTIRNAPQSEGSTADWYKRAQRRRMETDREAHYPVHTGLALHFVTGLIERQFDVCAVKSLAPGQYEGHAFSYIHRTYLEGRTLPVVPVMLNTYYPPNTVTPARCVAFGRALKALIESYPEAIDVGVLASGGLSHFVVDEELDHAVIEALKKKDIGYLAGLDPQRLQAGSSEIRSWIATAAAATDLDLNWIEYVPVYRTPALTGIGLGFARWS